MLDDSPHPLLFLYSKADSTIPATFLDAITEVRMGFYVQTRTCGSLRKLEGQSAKVGQSKML